MLHAARMEKFPLYLCNYFLKCQLRFGNLQFPSGQMNLTEYAIQVLQLYFLFQAQNRSVQM